MSAAGGMLVHRRAMRERTSAPSGPQPVGDPKATESKDLDTAEATRNNEGRLDKSRIDARVVSTFIIHCNIGSIWIEGISL